MLLRAQLMLSLASRIACSSVLGILVAGTLSTFALGAVQIGGPFALSRTDGRPVTDASYRGRWLLIYFGYTSCPDVCPTVLSEIGVALKLLGPLAAKVQPIFITVDPVRDNARALGAYMSSFDSRIDGLRGTPEQTEAAAKAYHVYYRARALGNGEYTVDHSSFLYVVKPDGSFDELLVGDLPGHKLGDELRRLAE